MHVLVPVFADTSLLKGDQRQDMSGFVMYARVLYTPGDNLVTKAVEAVRTHLHLAGGMQMTEATPKASYIKLIIGGTKGQTWYVEIDSTELLPFTTLKPHHQNAFVLRGL